ncbi:MAG: hypothetical protein Kow00121_68210 [Elainellaceae cyanobacterium]
MELIHLMQHSVPWLGEVGVTWSSLNQHSLLWHSAIDWSLLAQFDTDVFRPVREFFDNFVESGQVWALLIGLIIGYLVRSLTTYG